MASIGLGLNVLNCLQTEKAFFQIKIPLTSADEVLLLYSQWGLVIILKQKTSSERVIKFNSLSWTADSKVHVAHISHVIIAYTLK